ncbi:CopG family transcriptional regulator [Rothia koreensis]|uniref:ribbon-helix-helix domain-containing protein n=1 Tax=Rothia koreensis TaxID=592378 RepID=UPI003F2064B1
MPAYNLRAETARSGRVEVVSTAAAGPGMIRHLESLKDADVPPFSTSSPEGGFIWWDTPGRLHERPKPITKEAIAAYAVAALDTSPERVTVKAKDAAPVLNAIISPETYQALDRRAARQEVTRSEVIREILADFLDDDPGPVEPKPFYRDKGSKTLNFAVTEEMRDSILEVVERSAGDRNPARMKSAVIRTILENGVGQSS